jgi:hypothetical protein
MMQAIVARSGARGLVGKGYIKDIAWFLTSTAAAIRTFFF